MTASDRPAINGQMTLEQGDELAFLTAQLPRALRNMFLLATVFFGLLWFALLTSEERALFNADTAAGIRHLLTEMGWMPFAVTAAWAVALFALAWLQFRRMPAANRLLRYTVDAEGIVTRDEAGAELKVPWAMVRDIKATQHLLLLKLNTRVWRYLPWRAFAPDDRPRLMALADQHVTARAGTRSSP